MPSGGSPTSSRYATPGIRAERLGKRCGEPAAGFGGGPDSRQMPMVQAVEEVAQVIMDLIEHPRADVYTRPGMRERVVAYYAAEDMAAAEAQLPGIAPLTNPTR